MAFTDTYNFIASAGSGGDGVVRWRREKYRPKGGPSGGDGGRGGDIVVRAVRDVSRLEKLTHIDTHTAKNGEPGSQNSRSGRNGEAYVLELPLGSVITRKSDNAVFELLDEHEELIVLEGGQGGFGNEHFKSSTNQRPMQCTKGKPGETSEFDVELRIIADVGLVGLPNAGKTSLLNVLTNAGAKVGDYPFTTLDPNLGVYYGYVLADIPGLIEGASTGKGLGHKFLRHVSRTRAILHCISLERDDIVSDYNVILNELSRFEGMGYKRAYVVLTKTDSQTEIETRRKKETLEKELGAPVLATTSILDDGSIKMLGDHLVQKLSQLSDSK